ncbi:hypothetical protein HU200_010695 [Digitaria exilis]|uniref:Transcription factor n=1 Tax=Digitaria exilis TaxID=1010633 RepID=A0A835KPS6_9POAL|nr:hypothetical protein HU200_010695 [Digitaria exilis]CAB3503039.1 unnamed protein product [Digitaria exilis]
MDDELIELVCAASTWNSSSSPSTAAAGHLQELDFSTAAAGHRQELDLVSSCEVLEQLLGIDDDCSLECLDDEPLLENVELLPPAGHHQPPAAAPSPPIKRRGGRGRKPTGPRPIGPTITHVEAERQRRDKLNRRFFELRAAVPNVSRMDRASLLADAASYIAELRGRVDHLEAKQQQQQQQAAATSSSAAATMTAGEQEMKLEVRMIVGQDAAALRLTSEGERHAPARLMVALRSLDLGVQHACVCRAGGGVTVQDVVVDVPAAAAMWDERRLRAELLHWLAGADRLAS